MKTTPLPLDLIRLDGDTQSRLHIHEDAVEDYAEILRNTPPGQWPFPPLDVFHDGSAYYLADGFHRDLGALRAGRASAPCVVHSGTAKDARIFAMTANDKHGLRLSRADKRACVVWLLEHGGKLPQREIAEKAGVSVRLVKSIVDERKPKLTPHQPPPVATKVQIALLQPEVGTRPVEDINPTSVALAEPSGNGHAKRLGKYERSFWYKQWDTSIGPLCRLVDKIANDLGEAHGARHKGVKRALEQATREMLDWMKVKP